LLRSDDERFQESTLFLGADGTAPPIGDVLPSARDELTDLFGVAYRMLGNVARDVAISSAHRESRARTSEREVPCMSCDSLSLLSSTDALFIAGLHVVLLHCEHPAASREGLQ
jgi:hypothetical protein